MNELNEAKRYVRRYYIRPQGLFASNKAEILKALIEIDNSAHKNCTVYTLLNLGDEKDVTKLTNKDIIYYYDNGVLYDKNHVKVMDYDLYIKHEEKRDKINPDAVSDITFKDTYDDRMTELTTNEAVSREHKRIAIAHGSDKNELNLFFEDYDACGNKLVEGKAVTTCCICGEPIYGYGNNADPVDDGVCCDACNIKFVLPARLEQMHDERDE